MRVATTKFRGCLRRLAASCIMPCGADKNFPERVYKADP